MLAGDGLRWQCIDAKRGAKSCHSFHSTKALALPGQSKRATPLAPRRCRYMAPLYILPNEWQDTMRAVYNTPCEALTLPCS